MKIIMYLIDYRFLRDKPVCWKRYLLQCRYKEASSLQTLWYVTCKVKEDRRGLSFFTAIKIQVVMYHDVVQWHGVRIQKIAIYRIYRFPELRM